MQKYIYQLVADCRMDNIPVELFDSYPDAENAAKKFDPDVFIESANQPGILGLVGVARPSEVISVSILEFWNGNLLNRTIARDFDDESEYEP